VLWLSLIANSRIIHELLTHTLFIFYKNIRLIFDQNLRAKLRTTPALAEEQRHKFSI